VSGSLSRALSGIRVLEVGDRVAVGGCGSLLAHLGASVTVLEPTMRPAQDKWSCTPGAVASKNRVNIDRTSPEDLELVRTLADSADVVLLSTDRSAFPDLDLDMASGSRERSGKQVVMELTAFGSSGPLSGQPASEALVQAYTGAAETTGRREGPPLVIGAPVLEMETAVYGAAAVLAALWARDSGGPGQRVEVAMFDVGVNALLAFLGLPLSGQPVTRDGNRHLALAPWNAYRALDGWVQICAPTDALWRRLCDVMETPDHLADPRFASPSLRLAHQEDVDQIVATWVSSRTAAGCVDALTRQVIPAGHVISLDEVAYEPNLIHRRMIRRVNDPDSCTMVALPGSPIVPGHVPRVPVADSARGQAEQAASSTPPSRSYSHRATRPGAASAASAPPSGFEPPLQGIRVVEIGMNTVAPIAGRHLAALGADVIKVEPPRGDSNRWNPPLREDGQSYVFALSNTGKRGLVLDLSLEGDREQLWDLLGTADILIENLKPGSLGRLGFGHSKVAERLPHLIYCSINGFGHDSLYPDRPALDTVIQATSGLMGSTVENGIPYKAGISVGDQIGGQLGLVSVLAALHYRDQTGLGCSLDLTMQDGIAWVTHPVWQPWGHAEPVVEQHEGRWVVVDETGSAPVLGISEVLKHPHTRARGLLVEVPTADGSSWTVVETPLKFAVSEVRVTSAMPELGHADPQLTDELRALGHPSTEAVS
jgi:crotonobetainyl-CoA:carnitine CoA-transferase CaiB-like acyl-CoA transferase